MCQGVQVQVLSAGGFQYQVLVPLSSTKISYAYASNVLLVPGNVRMQDFKIGTVLGYYVTYNSWYAWMRTGSDMCTGYRYNEVNDECVQLLKLEILIPTGSLHI